MVIDWTGRGHSNEFSVISLSTIPQSAKHILEMAMELQYERDLDL